MNPLVLGSILELGKDLISRFFPNKEEAAKAEAELLRMAADGELKTLMAQLEINAKEAQNPSIWVSGWRPFFGWIGGAGFGYAVLVQPLLAWGSTVKGWPVPPILNIDLLWSVITGLLGLGGLRSFDKLKGTSK